MQPLNKKNKYRNSFERAALRKARKRRRWKLKKRRRNGPLSGSTILRPAGGRTTIVLPRNFSLRENTKECQEFFATLDAKLHQSMCVTLDLRDVQNCASDAILYLYSVLDQPRQARKGARVIGNLPRDEGARSLFVASGFLELVTASKVHRNPDEEDTLPIERVSGTQVDNEYVQRIYDFCKDHEVGSSDIALKTVNSIILELMANTWKHAAKKSGTKTWYSLAVYMPSSGAVLMCFLDRGRGIPATIRKRVIEYLWPPEEYELLQDALSGKTFRSSTGDLWRGNGLPKVKQGFDKGTLTELFMLSGHAHLDLTRNQGRALESHFGGTLYSWVLQSRQAKKQ